MKTIRMDLHTHTLYSHDSLLKLEDYVEACVRKGINCVAVTDHNEIDDVGRYLFDHGIYVTMAAYPLVPKDEVGFRIQPTAAHSDEEVDELIAVLGTLKGRFQLDQLHVSV